MTSAPSGTFGFSAGAFWSAFIGGFVSQQANTGARSSISSLRSMVIIYASFAAVVKSVW
jgi:hypothetical protein